MVTAPPFLTAWPDGENRGVIHGFFGRRGGVSTGVYDSLNVGIGSGDRPESVAENRERVRAALGLTDLVSVYQVHGRGVVQIEAPWSDNDRPEGDAMVTDRPGVGLFILTADCVPVLFADTANQIVGAAHAGWKGALAGVCEATIGAMVTMGSAPERISAAIGPAIQQASYEVGPEFRERFLDEDAANRAFFSRGVGDRWQFDITGYVSARLERCGLSDIEALDIDTCADADFFSNRRRTHRGEPDYGRNASVIALSAN